jgi:hypothetical protein
MHSLQKRLRKIEATVNLEPLHVVTWGRGQTFASALKRSGRPACKASRLLIHLQAMEGGHGSPVVPVPMTPDGAEEYSKAQAWVKGSPNSRIAGA